MSKRAHSASSLKMLKQCELKYWFRYEEKAQPLSNIEEYFPFGTSVHKALEELYLLHKSRYGTDYKFSRGDYDFIYSVFIKSASKEKLFDQSLLEEGWNIVKSRMDSFDYSEEVLEVEKSFEVELFENGPIIRGYIDKVIKLDDSTIVIVDYKTSKISLTETEADSDLQLSIYDLIASVLWPDFYNVVLVLDYLRSSPVMTVRNSHQRKLLFDWLSEIDKYTKDLKVENIKPSVNTFCGSCEYRYRCDAYKSVEKNLLSGDFMVEGKSQKEVVDKWDDFSTNFRVLESRKRELSMQVEKVIRDSGDTCIYGSNKKLQRYQGSRITYNIQDLLDFMTEEEVLGVCTVNKAALDNFLYKRPDLSEKVKRLGTVSYNSPFLKAIKV